MHHLHSSATTNTVSYTIKDCELYYLQSSTYAGKSGKGRNLRDLSSKGSKSYGGEGIDVVRIIYVYLCR